MTLEEIQLNNLEAYKRAKKEGTVRFESSKGKKRRNVKRYFRVLKALV